MRNSRVTGINADGPTNLTITLSNASDLFEDGNDSVTVTVSLSDGASLHGAIVRANDYTPVTLTATTPSAPSGLTITPATEFEGSVSIGGSAVAHDAAASA